MKLYTVSNVIVMLFHAEVVPLRSSRKLGFKMEKKPHCCHWCSLLRVLKSGHSFHILDVTAIGVIISKFLFSLTVSGEFDAAHRYKMQNHTDRSTLRITECSELKGTHKDAPVQLLSEWDQTLALLAPQLR